MELHREALRLDSTFAAAHAAVGVLLLNQGDTDAALASVERALALRERLTEREGLALTAQYHMVRREYAQSIAAMERVLEVQPDGFGVLNNLANAHSFVRQFEQAEKYFKRAIDLDTTRYFAYANLGEMRVKAGRMAAAEQAFRDAAKRAPGSSWAAVAVAQVPYAAGNTKEAVKRLRRLVDDPNSSDAIRSRARDHLSAIAMAEGRLQEAVRLAALNDEDARQSARRLSAVVDDIYTDALILRRPDDLKRKAAVIQQLADSVRDDPMLLLDAAAGCGWAGDAACADRLISASGRDGPLQPWTALPIRFAHAARAAAHGERQRAIEIYRALRDPNCDACELPFVGFLFEQIGQPDSAAAAYEKFIASSSMDRIWADAALVPIHESLARYYDAKGDHARAVTHYARVVALWNDADAPLQPRVAEARRRLIQLQPDR